MVSEMEVRRQQAREHWVNGILFDAPDSWDSDEAAEGIALDYVAELENRLDEAGISREKHV